MQFKKREKHPWKNVTFSKVAKSNTPPWVFFTFLHCTDDTKLRKASQINSNSNKSRNKKTKI